MKLSVCMIVKNEEKMLEKTLPSLKQAVDEIILVDTGSSDGTIRVAEKYGAEVFYFKWKDDFSAARNASLERATGDWIIWIDADEFVKAEDLETLKKVLEASKEDAYYLPIYDCKFGDTSGSSAFYFRLKVFRNHKGIHFQRAFNEQVHAASGELLGTSAFLPNVRINHWGKNLSPEKMKDKKQRNFRILKECLEQNPNDPYYHLLLADNSQDIGDKETALLEYKKVAGISPEGPLAATAHLRRARILVNLKKYEEAYADLKETVRLESWNAEAYNLIGVIYLSVGNIDKAIQVLEHSLKLQAPKDSIMGFDAVQYTYLPHFLLGNAYLMQKDNKKALSEFRAAYKFNANAGLKAKIEKLEKEAEVNG